MYIQIFLYRETKFNVVTCVCGKSGYFICYVLTILICEYRLLLLIKRNKVYSITSVLYLL